ncbi:MAG: amidohydrolase [Ardenticatenaceae bacterium]
MNPTLILFNGNFYTQWEDAPEASAVAMRDGRIMAVGDDGTIRALAGAETEQIDLEGRFALPGLTDAHIHFYSWAIGRNTVQLAGAESLAEVQARLRERVETLPAGRWVNGRGWNETEWEPPVMPCAADLDALSTEHPIFCGRADGHGAVANSMALALAGITRETPDPEGGVIERDEHGEPTGRLFEQAIRLVGQLVPAPTEEENVAAIREAIQACHRIGLTAVHDQRVKEGKEGAPALRAYQRLHGAGELKLRVTTNVDAMEREHAFALGVSSGFGDDILQLGHLKIFVDGSLGSQTAWMVEPFEGTSDNYGVVVTTTEEIHQIVQEGQQNGWVVSVHAIGDRANREMLDILEELAHERDPNVRLPHRIEHVQTIQPADLPRLAELDVIASMQPIHATEDMIAADRLWGTRGYNTYPFRRLIESGATLAFGSDCPVSDPNPFFGIHAAVTRQRRDGTPPGGWYPAERMTVQEAIAAYTTGAAQAVGLAQVQGRLAPGYFADMIVLDRNLLTIEPSAIFDTQVEMVVFNGQVQEL